MKKEIKLTEEQIKRVEQSTYGCLIKTEEGEFEYISKKILKNMKKGIVLVIMLVLTTFGFTQDVKTFCEDNRLEYVNDNTIKYVFYESASVFPAMWQYKFEATFKIKNGEMEVQNIVNTEVSNNGFLIDPYTYRGLFKDNLPKKTWTKLVESVHSKLEATIVLWYDYKTR